MSVAIDFDALKATVKDGTRRAFGVIRESGKGKPIFGYALYSDDSAMTICHACGSHDLLASRPDEPEVRWICHEWDMKDGAEHLDEANAVINASRSHSKDSDEDFEEFRDKVFETCVKAMAELIAEGFFGNQAERDKLFLTFSVSDTEDVMREVEWSRRLNTPVVVAEYNRWVQSWS